MVVVLFSNTDNNFVLELKRGLYRQTTRSFRSVRNAKVLTARMRGREYQTSDFFFGCKKASKNNLRDVDIVNK